MYSSSTGVCQSSTKSSTNKPVVVMPDKGKDQGTVEEETGEAAVIALRFVSGPETTIVLLGSSYRNRIYAICEVARLV